MIKVMLNHFYSTFIYLHVTLCPKIRADDDFLALWWVPIPNDPDLNLIKMCTRVLSTICCKLC